MRLGKKITVVMLLMTILAVAAVAATSYWLGRDSLRDASIAGLERTADLKAKAIDSQFRRLREDAEIAQDYYNIRANLPVVTAYADERSHPDYQRAREMLDGQLDAWLDVRSEVANLLLADPDGRVVYSVVRNRKNSLLDNPLPEPSGRSFREGSKAPYISDVYESSRMPGAHSILITAPVVDMEGEFAGVLALEIAMEPVWDLLVDTTGMGETGETLVATQKGDRAVFLNPLRHDPDAALRREAAFGSERSKPIQEALRGSTGSGFAVDYRDEPVVAAWRPLETMNWGMVAKMDESEAFAPLRTGGWLTLGAVFVGVVVALLISLTLSRPLSESLQSLLSVAERSQQGELGLEAEVRSRDEIGELAAVFNGMLESFRDVVDQAKRIAEGDYSTRIVLRSEQDELGLALRTMTETLERAAEAADAISKGNLDVEVEVKSERDLLARSLNAMVASLRAAEAQNKIHLWSARSQAEFNDAVSGNLTMDQLGQEVVRVLCRQLDAPVGALYVREPGGDLVLAGAAGQDDLPERYKPGVGLIGRVAREKERLVLEDMPDNFFRVSSGFGDFPPKHVLVMPALHEGEARGVLEVASIHPFDERRLDLLTAIGPTIGLSISEASARDRIEELLSEAQAQTEALTAQQEELRQANEELEEQTQLLEEEREVVEAKNREILHARQKLQERADQLARSSQYKSDFLANMSHELRTPLNSLLILARLLAENRDGNLNDKETEYAQTIQSAGVELLELINEILDLAKIEAGKMPIEIERCSLSSIEDHLKRNFEPVAKQKGVGFEVRIAPGSPEAIMTDVQRLKQVLKNLLSNAFKFTKVGGVTIDIGAPEEGWKASAPSLASDETVVVFSVKDTGIGIPEDKQQLIFEAFQQAESGTGRKYGGTGLGLSISKEIASLLGGEISMSSVPGEGTTFSLFLPLESRSGTKVSAAAEAMVAPTPVGERGSRPLPLEELPAPLLEDDRDSLAPGDRVLLIVEDDEKFAAVLRDRARERGFRVLVTGDGGSGLMLAKTVRPDAITLDLRLPDMSGWSVLDALKHDPLTQNIPVHILSVEEQSSRGVAQGAVASMKKPSTPAELTAAFETIEGALASTSKHLLIVEDDEIGRRSIVELVGGTGVETSAVGSGAEALELLESRNVDCVVVDLGLPDMDGFEFIDRVRAKERLRALPIIVYTGRVLTPEEEIRLKGSASTIIIKDVRSPDRLLAETALFLRRVEDGLPAEKKRVLHQVHDQDMALEGKHVLVVDDDTRNIFALQGVLEGHGMQVSHATSGKAALDFLGPGPAPVDLVLMDIMMPEMDGYETMRRVRTRPNLQTLPLIAVTAKAMKGDRKKCLDAGASDYITKPVDPDQLLSLLRVWLYQADAEKASTP